MEDVHELHVSAPIINQANFVLPSQCRRLALLVVIPAIQVTFYAGAIGGNMNNVRLLYTNNDHCKQHMLHVSCRNMISYFVISYSYS